MAPFWQVSLAAAQVEVDEDTGQVHLQQYVSIADVGKAIHPLQCEAQEEGGMMMGTGVRLKELPLTPERVRAAIAGRENAGELHG